MPNEVTSLVSRLCGVYHRELTEDLVIAYRTVLDEVSINDLRVAEKELLATHQWMPTPADIKRVAYRISVESSRGEAEPEHWRRDTHNCHDCQDTGWITVWTPDAMWSAIHLASGKITRDQLKLTEAVAKCACIAGQRRPGKAATISSTMLRLDRRQTIQEQVSGLIAWGDRAWNDRRIEEFDRFNES